MKKEIICYPHYFIVSIFLRCRTRFMAKVKKMLSFENVAEKCTQFAERYGYGQNEKDFLLIHSKLPILCEFIVLFIKLEEEKDESCQNKLYYVDEDGDDRVIDYDDETKERFKEQQKKGSTALFAMRERFESIPLKRFARRPVAKQIFATLAGDLGDSALTYFDVDPEEDSLGWRPQTYPLRRSLAMMCRFVAAYHDGGIGSMLNFAQVYMPTRMENFI